MFHYKRSSHTLDHALFVLEVTKDVVKLEEVRSLKACSEHTCCSPRKIHLIVQLNETQILLILT